MPYLPNDACCNKVNRKCQHPYSQIEHEQQFAEWNTIVQYFSLHFYVR